MNSNSSVKTDYYLNKDDNYYASHREDIFAIVRNIGFCENTLEVGCGNGELLLSLKANQLTTSIVGLDPYGKPKSLENFENFYTTSIEDALPHLNNRKKFDLIIFADVLEHLLDPWTVLSTISTNLLKEGGHVIISIPNFRNFITLSQIIFRNSFQYEKAGVLDKTHLRFFCRKDLVNLVEQAGLEIKLLTPSFKYRRSVFFKRNRLKYINAFTLNIFPFWIADQLIAVGQKKNLVSTP